MAIWATVFYLASVHVMLLPFVCATDTCIVLATAYCCSSVYFMCPAEVTSLGIAVVDSTTQLQDYLNADAELQGRRVHGF